MAAKYEALNGWLRAVDEEIEVAKLTFADLAALVGPLPVSATRHRSWWGNSPGAPQSDAWLSAGWLVESVTPTADVVIFVRGSRAARPREPSDRPARDLLDGAAALAEVARATKWRTVEALVAAHTVFLPPGTVRQVRGSMAVFPVVRDPFRRDVTEVRADGRQVMYDDNTVPAWSFITASGLRRGPELQFNHIWSSRHDPDSYTALWNICCTPAFLAKTSDTHPGVKAILAYRSFELYGRHPASAPIPSIPMGYENLTWGSMPVELPHLEQTMRARLRSAPKSRAALAARTVGWCFSDGPDATV